MKALALLVLVNALLPSCRPDDAYDPPAPQCSSKSDCDKAFPVPPGYLDKWACVATRCKPAPTQDACTKDSDCSQYYAYFYQSGDRACMKNYCAWVPPH